MELDIIEIRAYNYFECQRQVKQIDVQDLMVINELIDHLKPIAITHQRLFKLNFFIGTEAEKGKLVRTYKHFIFRFEKVKGDKLLLSINNSLKLPEVAYIHQLQNIYYDITGDVLKRAESTGTNEKVSGSTVTKNSSVKKWY
ncbi:MAG: hypothetical protein V4717_03095 [Bacteroidota bacterium]